MLGPFPVSSVDGLITVYNVLNLERFRRLEFHLKQPLTSA
jgi:hypothetical protein